MLKSYSRDLIVSVKEMVVERGWSVVDAANRLGLDIDDVNAIMDMIKQILS